ncbi:hypothetical protein [Nonlabens marinus]|uniref:Uncharacterized protein n=1 Tax=Nonlabens marinus S1-08 TaxID=1454201 RepID=W8VXS0_9FLAO|nr:hypothetical protein [Nonlabens marinus]BAO56412.1 hypothetical protein NMS_2403 [Nonlabens marinus S1-08]
MSETTPPTPANDDLRQQEFLVKHVFYDLENKNEGLEADKNYFSENDFASILLRAEHYGIALSNMEAYHELKLYGTDNHEVYRKKATHPQWYKSAFGKFKRAQKGMLYRATFKVSQKLLDRKE